ncbi:MAG: AAA family ATPase [Bacteroidaceae bacterium]|nr:AAA family ATPase [Bacteroidaceae bacterium]
MIDSIHIKSVASYDDNGVEIQNLKKMNFFFGANGTGKSTIARHLYNFALNEDEKDNNFSNSALSGFDPEKETVKVFDADYVNRDFYNSDSLDGVFSLNEKNEAIDKEITNKEADIRRIDSDEKSNEENKKKLDDELEKKFKDTYEKVFEYRNEFKFASSPEAKIKYGGDKKAFYDALSTKQYSSVKTFDELKNDYKVIFDSNIKEITKKIDTTQISKLQQTETQLNIWLDKVIVGKEDVPINQLIDKLNNRSWVEQGQEYVQLSDGKCPFCQQDLTEDFKQQLELVFDKEYKTSINGITLLKNQYESLSDEFIQSINLLLNEYDDNHIVLNFKNKVETTIKNNLAIIDSKLSAPNEKKQLQSVSTLQADVTDINQRIKKNNDIVSNKKTRIIQYNEDVLCYLAEKAKDDISLFNSTKTNIIKQKQECEAKISCLKTERNAKTGKLETLRQQTVNTKDAVERINSLLKTAGFDNFYIDEISSENNISKYRILREKTDTNSAFKTLSEGEKNFIAFLYFYQQCLGYSKDESTLKKIIVIDDPVSSMDSQVLFFVNSLIQKLVEYKYDKTIQTLNNRTYKSEFKNENLSQVFILTHNIYFFKEVSFEKRNFCKDTSFYIVKKQNGNTMVEYHENNPIKDDYTLLWDEIKKYKDDNNISSIFISNTMRRIIESYLNFVRANDDVWSVLSNFDTKSDDYIAVYSLLAEINDSSHCVIPNTNQYYQRLSAINPSVLYTAFENIFNKIGESHYKFMMNK